jgi:lysyl-tRNA synthetase class 2
MSRPSFSFLRPYLYRSIGSATKPEAARAYRTIQRTVAQTRAAHAYTGPHDVEKQKRLDQLQKVKPLGDYHPRLPHTSEAHNLSIRDFISQYETVQETKRERVRVFGRIDKRGQSQD